MTDRIDLHTHTTASDGSLSPAELVRYAQAIGLRAVAVTDHDTVDGVPEALAAGARLGFEVVPGVELSTDFRGKTLHALGYFLDAAHPPLRDKLAWAIEQRRTRNARMIERFRELGIAMTLDEVAAEAGGETIGRPHFAQVLVKKRVVNSLDEAFRIYLQRSGKAYLPKVRFAAEEAFALIRAAGGLPVLAHPGLIGWTPLELDDAVTELCGFGLAGLETLYTRHNPSQAQIFLDIAARHHLAPTGGSDFHGDNVPGVALGSGFGDLAVPYAWLVNLQTRRGGNSAVPT
jgi:predicted metal-dependent phosphoesterase TrpH